MCFRNSVLTTLRAGVPAASAARPRHVFFFCEEGISPYGVGASVQIRLGKVPGLIVPSGKYSNKILQ